VVDERESIKPAAYEFWYSFRGLLIFCHYLEYFFDKNMPAMQVNDDAHKYDVMKVFVWNLKPLHRKYLPYKKIIPTKRISLAMIIVVA
jgi:hypothetical protein